MCCSVHAFYAMHNVVVSSKSLLITLFLLVFGSVPEGAPKARYYCPWQLCIDYLKQTTKANKQTNKDTNKHSLLRSLISNAENRIARTGPMTLVDEYKRLSAFFQHRQRLIMRIL